MSRKTRKTMIPTNFQYSKKPNKAEYQSMFDALIVDASKQKEINIAAKKIENGKDIYNQVIQLSKNSKIPYYAIGIAHYMECNCDFKKHIHNGDSLSKQTVLVPSGRPINTPNAGLNKPYTFIESALDWVMLKKWNLWQDWGATDILARLELNNGLGYRNVGIPSPYLWSYSQFYGKEPFIGKFVADGKFEKYDNKKRPIISKQIGAAILLKQFIK